MEDVLTSILAGVFAVGAAAIYAAMAWLGYRR